MVGGRLALLGIEVKIGIVAEHREGRPYDTYRGPPGPLP